jgi:hypothetical protein
MHQIANPDTTTSILSALQNSAKKAEFAYTYAMQALVGQVSAGGYTGPWKADIHDPIY